MPADAPADLPRIHYPADLPVSARRDDIIAALASHQVVIVAGATGSGKTTQLPKMLLELGKERIAHTQPRRIAARAVAERIASELGQELGGMVGYRVRFTDQVGRDTRVTLMTDGILLNAIHRDPDLRAYDAIVIDEAHERSLTVDFLLGYLVRLLPRRPDLTVVVTSATIDPESFARHFASADGTPAPIIEVSGRTHPVEIRYRPLVPDAPSATGGAADDEAATGGAGADGARDTMTAIIDALGELAGEPDGDVLVFLSGEAEIRDAMEAIQGAGLAGTEVLPLYGRLSAAEQHRVFDTRRAPGIRRRVVLATNVAETSLTVPGIRFVIDEGSARISRWSARSKIQRLPIEPVSQASAAQRAGRSGREAPGIAIRLYSEADFAKRPEYTEPEILRTDLAAVLLQMAVLGLGDIADYPFLTPPDRRGVRDGLELLRELRALDADGEVTRIGRRMSRLPLDPRLGRMLVEAEDLGVAADVVPIVAALSIQDPRERPVEQREAADRAHARFASPISDFLSILALWRHLQERQAALSGGAFRRMLRDEFLSYLRVREWQDVVRQLERELGLRGGRGARRDARGADGGAGAATAATAADAATGAGDRQIHRAILAGLLSRIGVRDRVKRDYLGARGARFVIHPASAIAKRQPEAVMSAELVETSRLFARMNAAIDPAWAESLAGDLVVRTHAEPRWERRQGAAVVDERVTLYGVPIVAKRRVLLSRIDLPLARELFVRHALVGAAGAEGGAKEGAGGDWDASRLDRRLTAFLRENAELRARLAERQERERRRDLLLDDEVVVAFYLERLPEDVATTRDFERWWRAEHRRRPELLTMTEPDLVEAAEELDPAAFPAEWSSDGQRLPLAYRFQPGDEEDGVTMVVPLPLLPRLGDEGTDWLVPGLREELVAALLRTLPKPMRREVVPAGDWARRLVPQLPADADGRLVDRLAALIRSQTAATPRQEDFDPTRLPDHLRMGFRVVDERGRVVGRGRDLAALQTRLQEPARAAIERLGGLRALGGGSAAAAGSSSRGPADGRDAGGRAPARGSGGTPASRPPADGGTPTPPRRPAGAGPALPVGARSTTWTFGALPAEHAIDLAGNTVIAFPALVDVGDAVELRLVGTAEEAAALHRRGVRRLLALAVPSPAAHIQAHLTAAEKLELAASPYPSRAALIDDAVAAVADAAVGDAPPRDEAAFAALRDRVSATGIDEAFRVVSLAAASLGAARTAERAIRETTTLALMGPLADAKAQLAGLVHPGFVARTGAAQLPRLPVYLAGLEHRVRRIAENPGRDRVRQTEVEQAIALFAEAGGRIPLGEDAAPSLVRVRWLIEELRLSLFAQHLRTAEPVSLQRIAKSLR